MTRRMLRYTVPVDGQPHGLRLWGEPVRVEIKIPRRDAVEFWAEGRSEKDLDATVLRWFQVFGTGQPIPPEARWWGTTGRYAGLVWHLYEIPGGAA